MSFNDKKKPNSTDLKFKEKVDENLKNQITQYIFEILTKNSTFNDKVSICISINIVSCLYLKINISFLSIQL